MKLPFRSSAKSPATPAQGVPDRVEGKPDAELAKAAQRGEKRAFVEIVARHQAMVCGIAYGILSDFAASEDAAQEAFLTAWRKIHDLREPERLKAWLSQITRNAALGHLRRRHPERSLDEALEAADPALHPDEAVASDEETALVHEALTKLPETFRMPLILFYRDGQSVKSVAEALELSEDAVKQRLARGREMLRERMSGLIETVLTRTRPTAVFTMLIAAAIGALTAPAVVAGTAFTAAAAAASASTTATTAVTAMSTSKTSLVAALVVAGCLPLGYGARISMEPSRSAVPDKPKQNTVQAEPQRKPTDFSGSPLYAEWKKLHDEHGSSAEAMPALYKAISDIKDPLRRRVFRAAQIAEWAEVAPEAGLAYFLEKGRDAGQRDQFFEEWFRRDATSAVSALMNTGSNGDRLARRFLTDIAKRVPGSVAALAERLPKGDSYWTNEVRDAFAILASGSMESARTAAENLKGINREAALAGVANAWAKTDVEAAIAWAKTLPKDVDHDEIIRGALTGLAATRPAEALDRVQSIPPGGKEAYFATTTGARVLKQAALADYDATVAWLADHPGKLSRDDMMGMAGVVTERLNADALTFLKRHTADGSLNSLMPAVSSALLNQAAGQCLTVWDWLKSQPDSPVLQELRQQVINSTGYIDPEKSMKLVNDFPQTPEGDANVRHLVSSILNGGSRLDNFDQLLAAAPERMRVPFIETALMYLTPDKMQDPQKWLKLVAEAPETQRAQLTARAVSSWAASDPEEAIAWASALPAGDMRSSAVASAANAWIQKDSYRASEWVDQLPPGPDRDQAAASLVHNLSKDSPAEAWEWMLSISDPSTRSSVATRVLGDMARRDPAAARQWLDSADAALIPPERRAQMREFLDNGGSKPAVTPDIIPPR